jgi:chorismate mutase
LLRGIRGATTVENNERSSIVKRTSELLTKLVEENNIQLEDIGAAIFSATPDITAAFPAAAAREIGWSEVPLFGAQEMDADNGPVMCIRILILLNTNKPQTDIHHIYLHGAQVLRPDLVK